MEQKNEKIKLSNLFSIFCILVIILLALSLGYLYLELSDTESILDSNKIEIVKLHNTISYKAQEISDYKQKCEDYEKQIKFMDNHVAICPLNGSGLYHKYGCSNFDWTSSFSFMIYNVEQASNEGFSPCYYCSDLDNTSDKKTEIVYVTNTGTFYHRSGCSYLKSKNAITKEKAIEQGYNACSRCNP